MKKVLLTFSFLFLFFSMHIKAQESGSLNTSKIIFAYGAQVNRSFIRYVILLTQKQNPKICFLPTATGDNANYINYWYQLCEDLPMKPYVQRVFINSSPEQKTFEEYLLGMDAIIIGGGSTLNMLGIWKVQGIDTVLKKAYNKGIILAGGSAGSLCWFASGYSDSRPQKLTIIDGLGFINASHCAHYNGEPFRKPLYWKAILNKELLPGYACDDLAGALFKNGKYIKSISLDSANNTYYISVKNGKINEEKLPSEIFK